METTPLRNFLATNLGLLSKAGGRTGAEALHKA